jgi:SAM-dependent methyltransferase
MRTAYLHLANVYDELQQEIDPVAWVDYILALEQKHSQRSGSGDGQDGRPLVLDLGCGTGSFCLEMARRGYDPIGIDASTTMLDAARQKASQSGTAGAGCLFLQQDISRFELYGTVDLIVCLLDTVNHLTRPAEVRRLFRLCANYLNPGSLFIFDLATYKHLSQTLGCQIFFQDMTDYTLFWQNKFRPASGISRSALTLFSRRADSAYNRQDEIIVEKYYDAALISSWLAEAGLDLLASHAGLTLKPARQTDERHFFVARKPRALATLK